MRITIDTRWIRSRIPDGIGRVALELTRELIKEKKHIFLLLYNDEDIKNWIEKKIKIDNFKNSFWLKVNYPILSLKDFFFLPAFLKKQNIDIYYSFNYLTSPFHKKYKTVITVHDLIPYIFKRNFKGTSLKWKLFFRQKFITKKMLNKANIIVAVSCSTKNDIEKIFNIPSEKIKVVYNGISFPSKIISPGFLKEIQKEYILYAGRKDPYKNIEGLIKSYLETKKEIQDKYLLVIAGKKNELFLKSLKEKFNPEYLRKKVLFLDDIQEKNLPALYKNASLFVYPSLYEGFGLPPLEAMSFGIPVVSSNLSSLPEILGDAVFLTNPLNINEFSKAIEKVLEDENLRENLKKKGLERVKNFSWPKSAKQLLDIFEEISKEQK